MPQVEAFHARRGRGQPSASDMTHACREQCMQMCTPIRTCTHVQTCAHVHAHTPHLQALVNVHYDSPGHGPRHSGLDASAPEMA
eukprot:364191-Chlamydomonas_euryale.AAC.8